MATSMMIHLLFSFSCTIRSGLLYKMCLSLMTGEFHRIFASSFSPTCLGLYWYQY